MNDRKKARMAKIIKLTILVVIVAVSVAILGIVSSVFWSQTIFFSRTNKVFANYTPAEDGKFHDIYHDLLTFKSGEWLVVVLEWSCLGGNGKYDAVFIKNSKGEIYESTKNFCGYEGFWGKTGLKGSMDLARARVILLHNGFRVRKAG